MEETWHEKRETGAEIKAQRFISPKGEMKLKWRNSNQTRQLSKSGRLSNLLSLEALRVNAPAAAFGFVLKAMNFTFKKLDTTCSGDLAG